MQNLGLKLSLSLLHQELLHSSKMACKDDCWEGGYEEAKEKNGCGSSSLTIATKPK
jgi:hypothetical protein